MLPPKCSKHIYKYSNIIFSLKWYFIKIQIPFFVFLPLDWLSIIWSNFSSVLRLLPNSIFIFSRTSLSDFYLIVHFILILLVRTFVETLRAAFHRFVNVSIFIKSFFASFFEHCFLFYTGSQLQLWCDLLVLILFSLLAFFGTFLW